MKNLTAPVHPPIPPTSFPYLLVSAQCFLISKDEETLLPFPKWARLTTQRWLYAARVEFRVVPLNFAVPGQDGDHEVSLRSTRGSVTGSRPEQEAWMYFRLFDGGCFQKAWRRNAEWHRRVKYFKVRVGNCHAGFIFDSKLQKTGGEKNPIKHYFEAKDLQTKRQSRHIVQIFHPSIPE